MNALMPSDSTMDTVEDHHFYHCIRGFLCVQTIGGARIQRPMSEQTRKLKYYSVKIYCILCNVITFLALMRVCIFFEDGFSMDVKNMFAYLIISLYITTGVTQLGSIRTYKEILPFFDSLLKAIPERFDHDFRRPKIFINSFLAFAVCYIIVVIITCLYNILKPDPDYFYIALAKPWTRTLTETRISFMVTLACFVPSMLIWASTGTFLMTSGYYLRAGFIDLLKAMEDDPRIITHLAKFKNQHFRLSELVQKLNTILSVYIGPGITMGTFDMCFVVFTLGSDYNMLYFVGSIFVLLLALSTLLVTAGLSISTIAWVSIVYANR